MDFGQKLKSFFSGRNAEAEAIFDDLTDLLIESDIGAKTSFEIAENLRTICKKNHCATENEITEELKKLIFPFLKEAQPQFQADKTNVFLVLGVNGVGKTTTVAKIANYYAMNGFPKDKIALAAADTFRAAAIEQLQFHGEKLGLRVIAHQSGSDPASVVFDSAEAIKAKGGGVVFADSAGRLHNKENLVNELKKIDRVGQSKADFYKKILVVDGTTGGNALRQVETFNNSVGVDFVVISKFDSTAKGGIAVSVGKEFGIPIAFLGTGEKYEDLKPFSAKDYVESLFA